MSLRISHGVERVAVQAAAFAAHYAPDSLHQLRPLANVSACGPHAALAGRAAELDAILALLRPRPAGPSQGPVVCRIAGAAGIGKTTLANAAAHLLAADYPAAQLFVELGASGPAPLKTVQALARCIRALGYPPMLKLPDDEVALRALYLSALDAKRALIILDDAADAHVAALLPPPSCALLITSRQPLKSDSPAAPILPRLLPADVALGYLCASTGSPAQPSLQALVEWCQGLPFALTLVAAYLRTQTHTQAAPPAIHAYLDTLRDLTRAGYAHYEAVVRASLHALAPEQQMSLRALTLMPADFDGDAALYMARADYILDETHDVHSDDTLDRLVASGLLTLNSYTQRYAWHELTRAVAQSLMSAREIDAAANRHAAYYLGILSTTRRLYKRGGEHAELGLAILDAEWPHIVAGQAWAAAHGSPHGSAYAHADPRARLSPVGLCNDYADAGVNVLSLRLSVLERIRWLEAALSAARLLRHTDAEGAHLSNLGLAHIELGDYRKAIHFYRKARDIWRSLGDYFAEARLLGDLGAAYRSLGELRRALVYFGEQLELQRKIGDRRGECAALGALGAAHAELNDAAADTQAIEFYTAHIEIAQELGDNLTVAIGNWNLGLVYERRGDLPRAIEALQRCVDFEAHTGHPDAAADAAHVQELRRRSKI